MSGDAGVDALRHARYLKMLFKMPLGKTVARSRSIDAAWS
jgi:hypothetical protein